MEKSLQVKNYLQGKSDLLILVLITLSTFFQFFPLFIGHLRYTFYLPLVTFLLIIVLQFLKYIPFEHRKEYNLTYFLLSLWLFYGCITIFWSYDQSIAIIVSYYRFVYLLIFYSITQFINTKSRIFFFNRMIWFLLLFNVLVAIWEMLSLQHLPTSKRYLNISFTPTGAFHNENSFAAVIMLCTPFLFYDYKKYYKIVSDILIVVVFIVFAAQGARLALMLYFPIMLYYFYKRTSIVFKVSICSIIVLTTLLLMHRYPAVDFIIRRHIDNHVFSFGSERESPLLGSMDVRKELYTLSIMNAIETRGFGKGIGNFERSISHAKTKTFSKDNNPHSLFFEITSSEGLISLITLSLIVFLPLLYMIRNDKLNKNMKFFIFWLVTYFTFSNFLPGNIRSVYLYWTVLSFVYVLSLNNENIN